MKTKHLLFSIFAAVGLVTGCLSEPEFEPMTEDGIRINVDGSVSQAATKVNADGFEDGDALGLYAVNYEDGNQTSGVLKAEGNQADHVKYIFDYKNWKWNPIKPVYYKDVNTNVDLYAFYPYAEPESVEAYNFEVKKDQSTKETNSSLSGYEASDFLWAKVENVSPTEAKIKMRLDHKMAGVHVVLTEGEGFAEAGDWDLLDKKVLVTNTTRKATINMATGEVTPLGGAQATGIVMCPQTDGSFRAIVVPQTVEAGTQLFSITIGGQNYGFTKAEDFTYVPGRLNKFTIRIKRKYPSGDYELEFVDSEIVDWRQDLNTHEGEARQYYCVNVTEPGTLGRLIKADKKNPDKIKNLKVSGRITDSDFYFMRDSMAILEAVNLKESKIAEIYIPEQWGTLPDGSWGIVAEAMTIDGIIPSSAFYGKKTLYYFAFPEKVTTIGSSAFCNSSLSGALVLPDETEVIESSAFSKTNISSVVFSSKLTEIRESAFYNCNALSGTLLLPQSLTYIGPSAFSSCSFSGQLHLPDGLKYLGKSAFSFAGTFSGSLTIPPLITEIQSWTFFTPGFTGTLNLNNVIKLGEYAFAATKFQGEVVIPEGIDVIPSSCFGSRNSSTYGGNNFTSVVLPSTLKIVEEDAFFYCSRLMEISAFPEGMVSIGKNAFGNCSMLTKISLPSTLQTIQSDAFNNCYGISKITSLSTEPPTIQSGAFNGVAKDNFTVEVPSSSVKKYQADSKWGEFRRISAHYDFSISRSLSRTLNAQKSKKYILRTPANHEWLVESKPDWITVSPSSGSGKTEITITFDEMTADEVGSFEAEFFNESGFYVNTGHYNGRAGEIVFLMKDKDYRETMTVEQYDYDASDGDVIELNKASIGDGVDIVFLGDCYDARDIASGDYVRDIEEAIGYYFAVEPYKTYKDYFNVYMVIGESDDSGMGTLNTIKDSKFGSSFGEKNIVQPNTDKCFEYACKAPIGDNVSQTMIVLVENTTQYGGVCYMWGDGSAIACCPKSADAYPYDFRGIVQHEAGGHGFGKLADEYIYHNAFISTCLCTDGCGHILEFNAGKSLGWYRNLELIGDMHQVGWSHLIFHPQYSDYVDMYEGGYFHTRGVFRSEATSCMNNNIPYFSAISRQAIVERIMDYAGEEFTLEKFYENDSDAFGATTKGVVHPELPVETLYNAKQHAPVFMGDKPNFKK